MRYKTDIVNAVPPVSLMGIGRLNVNSSRALRSLLFFILFFPFLWDEDEEFDGDLS